ncbi:hypothetical protein GPUN_2924 [Glaciecola punicea ACAM 611]|uniref:Uncharacterized protein n=1 Tax=Glaciecola punicea ACAM 611 TaxID=1121923 RepID=H5TFG0_9ALTE|nr:hypothetical protein GPUN_2924 [Glaciecola punicea ACAM 611]
MIKIMANIEAFTSKQTLIVKKSIYLPKDTCASLIIALESAPT